MKHVVFVCTANICRSPSAEYYMKHVLAKLGATDRILVTSSGVMGLRGQPADPIAAKLLGNLGIDMSGHVSRGIERAEMQSADHIVVMEKRHRAWFRDNMPEFLPKVSLVREHLDGPQDLRDPIGEPIKAYHACLDLLFQAIENLTVSLRYPA